MLETLGIGLEERNELNKLKVNCREDRREVEVV